MRLKRLRRRWLILGSTGFVIAWPIVAWFAASLLIVRTPLTTADAIVVLSGAAAYDERARYASSLYRSGVSRRIILTNDDVRGSWSQSQQRNPYFYERAHDLLIREGVPANDITVLKQPVFSTRDEALLLHDYVNAQSLHSIVIVTSAYHSRRALRTFLNAFEGQSVVIGVNPVPTGQQTPPPGLWWLYWRGWQSVPPEYPKLIYYRIRY